MLWIAGELRFARPAGSNIFTRRETALVSFRSFRCNVVQAGTCGGLLTVVNPPGAPVNNLRAASAAHKIAETTYRCAFIDSLTANYCCADSAISRR